MTVKATREDDKLILELTGDIKTTFEEVLKELEFEDEGDLLDSAIESLIIAIL